ncbi:MAG TPA: ABC transporter ATP-binding protein [Kofleriaceae bacterium]|nr:ABC transporter ATP-binding protein [Kofleriaceae bacterium]
MSAVIEVKDLRKSYRTPLRRRVVEALHGISFAVPPGEIFAFVGPNGAGKTTTIRCLMGLIRPTSGSATVFGEPVPSRAARRRLGFLPESPYFYEYLTAAELLDLVGRLFGMERAARRKRADELLALVGLDKARKRPMKSFSKGMLQRAGIAQALMSDPELVVLDEPTSGLDPLGRKEVRDIIVGLRDAGKTVFFSSHILADVEAIADRVAIIVGGRVHDVGPVDELVDRTVRSTAVTLRGEDGTEHTVDVPADGDVDALLAEARGRGERVVSVTPRHERLEDLFLRRARGAGEAPPP